MQRKLIKIRFQGIMLSKLSHQNTKYQVSVNKVKSKTKSMQNQQDSEKKSNTVYQKVSKLRVRDNMVLSGMYLKLWKNLEPYWSCSFNLQLIVILGYLQNARFDLQANFSTRSSSRAFSLCWKKKKLFYPFPSSPFKFQIM